MRSKKEQDEERYFGLQEFDKYEDAFEVMKGSWGETNGDAFKSLYIADDSEFCKMIILRAAEKYMEYKDGKISRDDCDKALLMSEECRTDYLVDFDFFLWSKKSGRYFTSRMSFCDDGCNLWNERQWSYFQDLLEIYDFDEMVDRAIQMVDKLWDDYGEDCVDEICAALNICL